MCICSALILVRPHNSLIIFVVEGDNRLSLEDSLVEIFNAINEVVLLSDPQQDGLPFLSSSSSPYNGILIVIVDCVQNQA